VLEDACAAQAFFARVEHDALAWGHGALGLGEVDAQAAVREARELARLVGLAIAGLRAQRSGRWGFAANPALFAGD
jgi:LDH2 family malate/lactate/ureidoglycolate dehydrogenase